MSKSKIHNVSVVEGPLYEKWGEDSMVVCYDLWVEGVIRDRVYRHKHTFKGMTENPDGFPCPNYNAKSDAHNLADRVSLAGYVDTKYWELVCPISADIQYSYEYYGESNEYHNTPDSPYYDGDASLR